MSLLYKLWDALETCPHPSWKIHTRCSPQSGIYKAVWINSQRKIDISELFHKNFKHGYVVCFNWFVLKFFMHFRSHHVYKVSWRRCWWEILDSVPQHLSCSSIPSCARLDHPLCWYPSWGPSGTPLAECSSLSLSAERLLNTPHHSHNLPPCNLLTIYEYQVSPAQFYQF